jgi:DMSO reductase family type II enzyme chaperone
MKTMEEAVRFYNHFGLSMAESPRELPDHIMTQLEFLHFLAFREAEALEGDDDPSPFQRAQRDFVSRHPGRWVPRLRERLDQNDPMPFFRSCAGRALSAVARGDRERQISAALPRQKAIRWRLQV